MKIRVLSTALLIIAIATSAGSFAQSGLLTRPINTTCIAPAAPVQRLQLAPAIVRSDATAGITSGREKGVVYRGADVPLLQGHYVYLSAQQLMVEKSSAHTPVQQAVMTLPGAMTGLIEGDDKELYVIDRHNTVYKIQQISAETNGAPATLLSQTGCFLHSNPSVPATGLIPYAPASPLWSDNADKRRWIAMPDWHTLNTQITLLADGDFDFPNGTVLIKEFRLGNVIAETRLLVKDLNGTWTGYSYEWNAQQTDATLLAGGKTTQINGQSWEFPSPFQCLSCHTQAANRSLGPEIAQLNSDYYYEQTTLTANQLTTLDSIGLISGGLSAPVSELDALPDPTDTGAPVDHRARGYLHSNCSHCHRPGGPGFGPMDFRYSIAGEVMGASNAEPWLGNLGVPGAKILVRGNPDLSVLFLRMDRLGSSRMPPLGTSIKDTDGLALIFSWIESGLGFGVIDSDGDQIADDLDNCTARANAAQRDSDNDGYGNACDPDLDNNGVVNFGDVALWIPFFNTANTGAVDFNGDGFANFGDYSLFPIFFLQPPGPSGLVGSP